MNSEVRRSALASGKGLFAFLLPLFFLTLFGSPKSCGADARLDEKFGTVKYQARDQNKEDDAAEKIPLYSGDRLRTMANSHATVWLKDRNPVKLGAKSTMQITAPPGDSSIWIDLWNGALYFFSRDKPKTVEVRTKRGTGAHTGTEFAIFADDDRTRLAVYDGKATLSNELGFIEIEAGEIGTSVKGSPPRKTTLKAENIVQWWLFYPAVLDIDDLNFSDAEKNDLSASLKAYRDGDLPRAFSTYPGSPEPAEPTTDAARIYLAGLLLSGGEVENAQNLLSHLQTNSSPAEALRWIIAAVQRKVDRVPEAHTSASEWLGLSYYYQARHELDKALAAARSAVERSPEFAFGWERVAELEFSFGRIPQCESALQRSLMLAPKNAQAHALSGFLLAARGKSAQARETFDRAIQLNASLANAWLGRGLIRIRTGDTKGGSMDLQTAAILEPDRSFIHSYLGKAFSDAAEYKKAASELHLAKTLDAQDPTAWLYSALLNQRDNNINPAIDDLEESVRLNDNRAVYRSPFLLDQDRAVRSANLAAIYRDAGLNDVSIHEASRAVVSDYANSSAHLFLANSYNELRDPNLVNLRYESATFSEYLVANLLAPVGATALSPQVSQQEYSRLFDRDRVGLSSSTSYGSDGDWQQDASQYGRFGNTAYAIDTTYRSQNGHRPNNDLFQFALSAQLKEQITLQDSIYFQAVYNKVDAGDTRQYYDPAMASQTLRVREEQSPNLFFGYHHEWSPGMHTLFLAGRLEDSFKLSEPLTAFYTLLKQADGVVEGIPPDFGEFGLGYRGEFEAGTFELQQICEIAAHTLILGGRFQTGEVETHSQITRLNTNDFPAIFDPAYPQDSTTDLQRYNLYIYDNWRVADPLYLSAGFSYDHLSYPQNVDAPPISDREISKDQFSPKIGITWTPDPFTSVRAAYTRSLGGLFFDQSVRLEPTQIAGFNQAFRSLIPESIAGPVPGSEFETFHVGTDHKFPTRTYLVIDAALLKSRAAHTIGVFDYFDVLFASNAIPSQTSQKLDYEEKSLTIAANQLIGNQWALGARYRISQSELEMHAPQVPSPSPLETDNRAVLHQLNLFAIFNHPCGIFARGEALWWAQSNHGYSPALKDDDFWQFNLSAGYRFPGRRAEILVGLLNIGNQDYRLNPLSLYSELPRHRTFVASFRFNF